MKRYFIILLCGIQCYFSSILEANSQDSSGVNNFTQIALDNTIALYSQSAGAQLRLYNGSAYEDYRFAFNRGQPYFNSKEAGIGAVSYDGILYKNVPMWYDLLSDKVIIEHYDDASQISLIREKIAYFTLHNHTFIHLKHDSVANSILREGFYDQLYQGQVTLFAKRINKLEQRTLQSGVERTIDQQVRYFLKKDGKYYTIKSQHALLNHLKDKKKELQQYIKQNKIRYGEKQEDALIKIAAYYDNLK